MKKLKSKWWTIKQSKEMQPNRWKNNTKFPLQSSNCLWVFTLQSTTIYNTTATNLTIQSRNFLSIWHWNFAKNQNGYLLKHANRDGYSTNSKFCYYQYHFKSIGMQKNIKKEGSNDCDYLRGVKKLLQSPWEGERDQRDRNIIRWWVLSLLVRNM